MYVIRIQKSVAVVHHCCNLHLPNIKTSVLFRWSAYNYFKHAFNKLF